MGCRACRYGTADLVRLSSQQHRQLFVADPPEDRYHPREFAKGLFPLYRLEPHPFLGFAAVLMLKSVDPLRTRRAGTPMLGS